MFKTVSRGRVAVRRVGLALVAGLTLTVAALPALGQVAGVLIVGDDRGGMVGARASEIEGLRQARIRVEIRGSICLSACTRYLGVGDVCVSPRTTFGIHGPTRDGRPLGGADFERWTAVMARHYAPPLRNWFMEGPRYRSGSDYSRLSGAELIRMGYPSC
ncbi:MAG: hypothetical protein IT542_06055 [Rubellimicrobium sp.]|nr:hypothetical protein [Rubellimicrobium sp.]